MNEKNLKTSPLKKSFKIKVPYKQIKEQMEVEFKDLSMSLKIPGFRPGKVPISFVKNKYFKDVINKTTEKLIREEGNKSFEKNKYRLAFQPEVKLLSELKENVDLEAEFIFEILPEFEIDDFGKMSLKKYVSMISENDIDNVIKKLHKLYNRHKNTKRYQILICIIFKIFCNYLIPCMDFLIIGCNNSEINPSPMGIIVKIKKKADKEYSCVILSISPPI